MRIRPGIILLLIWGLFLAAADILYLQYLQPSRLGETIAGVLHDVTGLRPSMSHLSFRFAPRAGVEIHNLELHPDSGHDIFLSSAYCRAEFSWRSLFRLKPVLSRLELRSPVIDILHKDLPSDNSSPVWDWPEEVSGMSVQVSNGTVRLVRKEGGESLCVKGLDIAASWPGLQSGKADIRARSLDIQAARHIHITLDNMRIALQNMEIAGDGRLSSALQLSVEAQMDALDQALGHRIADAYRYFPLPEPLRAVLVSDFTLNPRDGSVSGSGTLDLQALFPMNGHMTPLELNLPFSMTSADSIDIKDMALVFDRDSGRLSGRLSGLAEGRPVLDGRLDLQQFSLIRWFGFGRNMPAGLQQALNHISGSLDFRLTPQGVNAPRLTARVAGMTLEASGSCRDFRHPDVTISAHMKEAWLDRIFPELGGADIPKSEIVPPELPPPALPLSPKKGPGMGYKILLSADEAHIIKLKSGKTWCLITPAPAATLEKMPPLDPADPARRSEGHGVLLTIASDDLYGGSATSRVHLHDEQRVEADIHNAEMREAVRSLAGFTAMSGKADLYADLTFHGHSARARLENMKGTLKGRVRDGFFSTRKGKKMEYSELTVAARAQGVTTADHDSRVLPPFIDYQGSWDLALTTPDGKATAQSNAVLSFSTTTGLPLRMAPRQTSCTLTLPAGLSLGSDKAAPLRTSGKGLLSFDLQKGIIQAENIHFSLPDATVDAHLALRDLSKKPLLDASLQLKTDNLRLLGRHFGLSLPATRDASLFGAADSSFRLKMQDGMLSLSHMHTLLDHSSISGMAQWRTLPRRELRADLHVDHIKLDDYLPPASPQSRVGPLPLDFLSTHDLNMRLRIDRLDICSTPLYNLSLPLTLHRGTLHIGDINATDSRGGALRCVFQGKIKEVPPVLDSRFQLLITGIDALALSQERKQETLIAGTGNGQIKLSASIRNWGDVLKKANGNWHFSVRDGFFASAQDEEETIKADKGKDKKHNRTAFDMLSASGTVKKGVAHSENFLLRGPALTVRGSGTLDLSSRIIAAEASATLLGVPEIPIHIRGSLDNPETSYQMMGAVASTIGNIGTSTLDLVGTVLTAPFRLFVSKKTLGHAR